MEGKTSLRIGAAALCLLVLVLRVTDASFAWWGLGIVSECTPENPSGCGNCAQLKDDNLLTANQSKVCSDDSIPIGAISAGTRRAIVDCQTKFKNSKWNCSTFYGQHLFGRFISDSHTRETAVVNAYTVAGAIQSLAEQCHSQRIRDCLCVFDGPPREEREGGEVVFQDCKEDIQWATKYIDDFIGIDIGAMATAEELATVHNIQVGKMVVDNPQESCVCHGISGTCSVQTCHSKAPDINDIGNVLEIDYNGAIKVEIDSNKSLVNAIPGRDAFTEDDLVFTDDSPNFCFTDLANGVPGVEGRLCEPNGFGPNSCQNLCCDFGFHSNTFTVPEEKCSFVWCCRIECKIVATKTITEHRCNGPPPSGRR